MFWEPQYTKIEKSDPAQLLGYILMLEHTATTLGKTLLEKAKAHKGLKFLEVHVEEDIEHVEEAIKAIDSLDDIRKQKVIKNMVQSFRSYAMMIQAIQNNSKAA